MKKSLSLALALLMVAIALAGCGGQAVLETEPSESAPAPESSVPATGALNVAVQVKATESDFWQYMLIGAEQYGKDFPDRVKVTTYGPTKEADVDEAISILEQVIQTQPDGIVLASTNSDAPVPAIEDAYAKGIIMIIVDNRVTTDRYHAFLATDNLAGGALAADSLVEGMESKGVKEGRILLVASSSGSLVVATRLEGFINQMKSKYPQYPLYPETQYCENDIAKALTICENVFSANDDIVGVFGGNNMSGNGIAKFIAQEGLGDKVTAVCFDSDPEEIKAMREGNLYAMIIQDPAGFGYNGIDMVYKIKVEGYKVEEEYPEKYIDTGCTKITAENVDAPELQGLINPFLLKDGSATREW